MPEKQEVKNEKLPHQEEKLEIERKIDELRNLKEEILEGAKNGELTENDEKKVTEYEKQIRDLEDQLLRIKVKELRELKEQVLSKEAGEKIENLDQIRGEIDKKIDSLETKITELKDKEEKEFSEYVIEIDLLIDSIAKEIVRVIENTNKEFQELVSQVISTEQIHNKANEKREESAKNIENIGDKKTGNRFTDGLGWVIEKLSA